MKIKQNELEINHQRFAFVLSISPTSIPAEYGFGNFNGL